MESPFILRKNSFPVTFQPFRLVHVFNMHKQSYKYVTIDFVFETSKTMYDKIKWAVTRDFQQCSILTSVGSDEPVQPSIKLRNSNDVQSVAEHS